MTTATSPDRQRPDSRPPRDGLFRGRREGVEERADAKGSTLHGHFAVFNRWTKIDSIFEGTFMERIAPGAFKKTFAENRDGMRVLFQHGRDTMIGDRPLGPIDVLEEDDTGARYEVPLLRDDDGELVDYLRGLVPGLKAGLYGASFRFRVLKEEFDRDPGESEHNPEGIPERTVKEVQVSEFGPVTFPAYPEATAGVRSLTDQFTAARMLEDPERLEQLIEWVREMRDSGRTPDGEVEGETPAAEGDDAAAEGREILGDENHPGNGSGDAGGKTAEKPERGSTPPTGLYGLSNEKEEPWRLR